MLSSIEIKNIIERIYVARSCRCGDCDCCKTAKEWRITGVNEIKHIDEPYEILK